jgi:gliding motility-associated-like protein
MGQATVIPSGGTGNYSYSWSSTPTQTTATVNHLHAGTYTVTVSDGNCTNSITVNIVNIPAPTAAFTYTPSVIYSSNPDVQFLNQSSGGTIFNWFFGDGATSLIESPSHTYINPQSYTIVLVVKDNFGCSDTTSQAITINEKILILVPNIFTPNGDGFNDIFIPEILNIELLKMTVFNRWGDKIYISEDNIQGWDGTNNGKEVPDGVYFWIIEYKELNIQKKQKTIHGSVTLIR